MDQVTVAVEDHIATIVMDNPPVNAVSPRLLVDVREILDSFSHNRDIRVAILTAAGQRAFMAGADLRAVAPPADEMDPSDLIDRGRAVRDLFWSVYDCAVPVIAAVNGPAIGAGLALAAVCDIIVASELATFQAAEINVGLLGASAQLRLLVGRHKARELFFSGRPVTAAELESWGSVAKVVPSDQLMSVAHEFAAELASKSPIALRLAKESMNRTESLPLRDAYRLEQDYTARLGAFDDSAEARAAWVEKRSPTWKWR